MSLRVARLFLYPIKSCGSLEVEQFQIGESGPQLVLADKTIGDRQWMFVDPDGKFITQRTLPAMALLKPRLLGSRFLLDIQGKDFEIPLGSSSKRKTVSVWGKEVSASVIEGEFNQAASQVVGKPLQLVRFDEQSDREVLKKGKGLGVQTRFTDSQPYLVVTEESLRDLNSRLSVSIDADRFRPNIVLAGAEKPYVEESWSSFGQGPVILEGTKACGRCKIITVDPKTGKIPSSEPLLVLSQYRKKDASVIFGQYFLSRSFGETISKGDRFEAHVADSTG